MEKEMNLWDLCVAIARAIGRGCKACWELFLGMLRLTYRYWWIVLTLVVLAICAAFYYTRFENLTFKVESVALLNGATIQQFEQAYAPLRSGHLLPPDAAIKPYLCERKATQFTTYRVIDCLDDGTADYIDFKHKSSPTDTVKVQMQDRLCLQFLIKQKNMDLVPEIERAMLDLLNGNEAMQQSYAVYLSNLREEVRFNHSQAAKLDSLTSDYYFFHPSNASPMNYNGNGVNFYGDRRIRLFLDDIYEQHEMVQNKDHRMQLATAPVVLENHFYVNHKPVNGRMKVLVVFCLLGWIGGCILAELIEKRKAICAWLKQ